MSHSPFSSATFVVKHPIFYLTTAFTATPVVYADIPPCANANEIAQELLVAPRSIVPNASVWGPVLFVGLYAIRPLILFPSTVLTLAGGFVFGPVLGVIYTLIAGNTSATVAYSVGRYFGPTRINP